MVTTKKEDKKENSKQVENRPTSTSRVASQKATNEVTIETPTIAQPYEYKQPLILDPSYEKMVKAVKPIKNNDWATYWMLMANDKIHEEMVNEQYRRK